MARGCQAQHLIWLVSALSSSILYDIWKILWTVAVFYGDHVYHGRSRQITTYHSISRQITADHSIVYKIPYRRAPRLAYRLHRPLGRVRRPSKGILHTTHGISRHITAYHGRSLQITVDHGISRHITAGHGRSRQITADHGR